MVLSGVQPMLVRRLTPNPHMQPTGRKGAGGAGVALSVASAEA